MKLHKFDWPVMMYRSNTTGFVTEVKVELEISIPFDQEGFEFEFYDLIVQGNMT